MSYKKSAELEAITKGQKASIDSKGKKYGLDLGLRSPSLHLTLRIAQTNLSIFLKKGKFLFHDRCKRNGWCFEFF